MKRLYFKFMKFVLALLLSLTAVLYAQSSSSLFTGIGEYLAELIGDDVKSNEFCKANTTGLNLLILDGYFLQAIFLVKSLFGLEFMAFLRRRRTP